MFNDRFLDLQIKKNIGKKSRIRPSRPRQGRQVPARDPRRDRAHDASDILVAQHAENGDRLRGETAIPEIRRKRLNTRGAVAMAHQGNPALADSQIYVTLANRPDLNNRYTVFGHIIAGDEVPGRLERGDHIRKMSLKE